MTQAQNDANTVGADQVMILSQQREIERLREVLAAVLADLEIQIRGGIADEEISDTVSYLCESYGYGNVICTASTLWRKRDPVGAFLFGPCAATAAYNVNLIRAALEAGSIGPRCGG